MLRRSPSAAILDDGSRLAVLSTDHKVNIYDLSKPKLKLVRCVALDNPPHTIALSPKAEVLAAAYDGGLEVYSLAENATEMDQRAVKCDRVDSLTFSSDGTMLLGTTQSSKNASTVVVSAPYFTDADHDMSHNDLISHMWTSQILFPNSSRDCSHATLLPRQQEVDASWTLTYDRNFESFRAVRTDDLRNGTTYFTGPKPGGSKARTKLKTRLTPCTLPTVTRGGDLVAAGFLGNEIWLYGVPEGLDKPNGSNVEENNTLDGSNPGASTSRTQASPVDRTSQDMSSEIEGLQRWQVLVDKYRNVFAKGRRIAKVAGVMNMRWVDFHSSEQNPHSIRERLVTAAPGGVSGFSEIEEEDLASVDGGRLVILDFDWSFRNGFSREVTIEVGNVEPEMLEEENVDMATEIAIVRRRTVSRRDGIPRSSVVDALRPVPGVDDVPDVPPLPQAQSVGYGLDSTANEASSTTQPRREEPDEEGPTLEEVAEALDDPYSHTNPRSRNTLYRSATAVEANRLRNPQPRVIPSGPVEYRRTDGTELPHESDADNWVPPPPPYTKDADSHFPDHLRQAVMSRFTGSSQPIATNSQHPRRSYTTRESSSHDTGIRRRSAAELSYAPPLPPSPSWSGQVSHSTTAERGSGLVSPLNSRAVTNSSSPTERTPPIALSPVGSRRRPMSSYDFRPSAYRGRAIPDPESAPPVSPLPETYRISENSTRRPVSPASSPTTSTFPTAHHQLTLSGSNLQQRLAYPLPPPPPPSAEPSTTAIQDFATRPLLSELATTTIPPLQPQAQSAAPVRSPTAYQLNQLQQRSLSSPIPWQGGIPQPPHGGRSHPFPAGGPPKGALGAMRPHPPAHRPSSSNSRFRSPFRSNTENVAPARALSRSRSRGSNHSFSNSTPNLLRPQASRLETIYSIASRVSTRTRSREPSTRPESRMTTPRVNDSEGVMGRRRSIFRSRSEGPVLAEGVGIERERRGRGRMGRRQDAAVENGEEQGGRKRGRKCIVM